MRAAHGNERDGRGARLEWMLLGEGIAFSRHRGSDMSNEECMLATVTDDQEQEDVSTTSPRWIGGVMAARESLSLVMAHRRKGADPDILAPLKEDIAVGHRQVVCKSDQEKPLKAAQRRIAARRAQSTIWQQEAWWKTRWRPT